MYLHNLFFLENMVTFCMYYLAVLLAVSAGHIAHEAIYCLFYSLYIFKGDGRIQVAPLPSQTETSHPADLLHHHAASYAGGSPNKNITNINNTDKYVALYNPTHIKI